ncbi:GrpB family protein [Brevibacillus nitrificans]|uniref:GrpB family protein n=1 Tax=Brevibacillus nitrificans TaxID=651560 RepID=UPI002860D299|nr:GrpB family protein [Brevibacillus nitrificans]MDR7317318.1 GrpB-like predicted nucleotidyltransferase (UPF0157 family) [Brevibacillus nitrificans]
MSSLIVIAEYDPLWIKMFDELCAFVHPIVKDHIIRIEHVGSTSVPGLAAKPIVDMDVVVRTKEDVRSTIRCLAALGYVHEGDLGVSGREAFIPPSSVKWHHLYVCTSDNAAFIKHIRFRDYLRSHPEEAKKYGDLKRELARQYENDRDAYTNAKGVFVNRVLNTLMDERK